jgi:hypothetical protein
MVILIHRMYEDYFATVMNVFTGKGRYELNDGRQNLDWLRRNYSEDPGLHGGEPPAALPGAAPACAVMAMPETTISENVTRTIAKSRQPKICLAMLVKNDAPGICDRDRRAGRPMATAARAQWAPLAL